MLVQPFATSDYVNRDPEMVSWSQTGASIHAYEQLFWHFPLRLSSALPFSESDKDTSAEYYPPDCRGAPLYIKPSHTAHTHVHMHTPPRGFLPHFCSLFSFFSAFNASFYLILLFCLFLIKFEHYFFDYQS